MYESLRATSGMAPFHKVASRSRQKALEFHRTDYRSKPEIAVLKRNTERIRFRHCSGGRTGFGERVGKISMGTFQAHLCHVSPLPLSTFRINDNPPTLVALICSQYSRWHFQNFSPSSSFDQPFHNFVYRIFYLSSGLVLIAFFRVPPFLHLPSFANSRVTFCNYFPFSGLYTMRSVLFALFHLSLCPSSFTSVSSYFISSFLYFLFLPLFMAYFYSFNLSSFRGNLLLSSWCSLLLFYSLLASF